MKIKCPWNDVYLVVRRKKKAPVLSMLGNSSSFGRIWSVCCNKKNWSLSFLLNVTFLTCRLPIQLYPFYPSPFLLFLGKPQSNLVSPLFYVLFFVETDKVAISGLFPWIKEGIS